jgi:hypothetical protein
MECRCQYYTEGCEFVSTFQSIKSHEAHCPHRPFDCPFSVVVTKSFCWRGKLSGMWDHLWCKHTALALPKDMYFIFTVNFAVSGLLFRTLHARSETFFVVCRVTNQDLYCSVLYVGPEEKASEYKYRIKLTRRGSSYMTVYRPTRQYFVDTEALFRNLDCAFFAHGVHGHGCGLTSLGTCEVEIGVLWGRNTMRQDNTWL